MRACLSPSVRPLRPGSDAFRFGINIDPEHFSLRKAGCGSHGQAGLGAAAARAMHDRCWHKVQPAHYVTHTAADVVHHVAPLMKEGLVKGTLRSLVKRFRSHDAHASHAAAPAALGAN